jgi:hydrogenase maturation protease
MRAAARGIVIGIGNPDRGDDAAGRVVARLLRGALAEEIEVVEQDGEATALLSRIEGQAAAFLVDACASGAPAGTVRRFDVIANPLPGTIFRASTHGFGLVEAVELARALGRLPPLCIVYAIEGRSFAVGTSLSPPVEMAVADVARRLRAEIADVIASGGWYRCTKRG